MGRICFLFLVFSLGGVLAQESEAPVPDAVQATPGVEVAQPSQATEGTTSDQSDEGVNLKLRNLEEKINSLKDKVFRAKQRLAILQETVLSGALAGARCSIEHRNEVGSAFEMVSVLYYLDEAPIFKWLEGSAETKNELTAFDGSVVPGPHHLSVYLVYRGRGYGVFSYMKGYTFKLKAGYSFNVEEGQLVEITATAIDRGSLVKLDNRLYLSFDIAKRSYEEATAMGQKEEGRKDTATK